MKDAYVCSNSDGNTRRGWISSELDVLLASDNAFSLLSHSLVHQYEVFELENNYHPKLNEYIQLFFPMSAHICRVMFLTNRTPWTCFCMFFRNIGEGVGNNVASKQGIHHGHGFPSSLQVSASKVMAEEHIKRIQRKWDVRQREKIMRPGQWTANGCKWVIPQLSMEYPHFWRWIIINCMGHR